jgi:hypothetical protein
MHTKILFRKSTGNRTGTELLGDLNKLFLSCGLYSFGPGSHEHGNK